jgi:hypothetical protein
LLQLFPFIDYSTGLYYIRGNIQSQVIRNPLQRISFLIDLSATYTSISLTDANKLGIEYEKLQDVNLLDSTQTTKIIPNCSISFFPNTKTGILEYFDQIAVQDLKPTNIKQHELISNIPSVLGQDFISRYRVILQYPYMILER